MLALYYGCPCPNTRHLIITLCNNCEQTRILTLKSRAIRYINGVFCNRSLPQECQTYLRNCQEWYHASSTGWVIWEQVTLTYVTENGSYPKYRLMKDRSKLKLVLQPPSPPHSPLNPARKRLRQILHKMIVDGPGIRSHKDTRLPNHKSDYWLQSHRLFPYRSIKNAWGTLGKFFARCKRREDPGNDAGLYLELELSLSSTNKPPKHGGLWRGSYLFRMWEKLQ